MLFNMKLSQTLPFLFFAMIFTSQAYATGVGINATRVVYNEGDKSAPVIIRNASSEDSYLIQSYMTSDRQQKNSVPFEVLPPMFRMQPDSRSEVRIVEKANELPKDRESVFYLHVRAIPASSAATEAKANNGVVKIALESVIKVFYRPKNLPSSPQQAQNGLVFESVAGGLKIKNPSPYHVNFSKLKVGNQQISLSLEKNNAMLAPFSEMFYPTSVSKGVVSWGTINDLGGYNAYNQKL
jgi:fimbrial chaperone protein